jgi:hypothetical protein
MESRRIFLGRLAAAAMMTPALLHRQLFAETTAAVRAASIWIYPWDLVDEGYEQVLPRLHEHGLTSISLATAYHAGKFLSPHNPRHTVVFLEDGAVFFQPKQPLYGSVTPIVHSLVAAGHDLREARLQTRQREMELRSWVVCCHNTPLGMAHPGLVARTVFGDPLYHTLCPSHNEVRRYLRGLIRDISSYEVDLIELEALQFQSYSHGFHHEKEGIALTPAARFLLGLCFCDACVLRARTAAYDISALRIFTQKSLEQYFADPDVTGARLDGIESIPAELLEPLLTWRAGVIRSLLEELQECAGDVPLRQMMSVEASARRLVSVDPAGSAHITGGVLALGYVRDGAALERPLAGMQSLVGDGELTLGFQVGLPESGGKAEFLDRMRVARAHGVANFNFYNYGLIPLNNLAWITQSLR